MNAESTYLREDYALDEFVHLIVGLILLAMLWRVCHVQGC